jgi:hypothetical protein
VNNMKDMHKWKPSHAHGSEDCMGLWPYHPEHVQSCLITDTKQDQSWLVPGWEKIAWCEEVSTSFFYFGRGIGVWTEFLLLSKQVLLSLEPFCQPQVLLKMIFRFDLILIRIRADFYRNWKLSFKFIWKWKNMQ